MKRMGHGWILAVSLVLMVFCAPRLASAATVSGLVREKCVAVELSGETREPLCKISYELSGGTNNAGNRAFYYEADFPVTLGVPTREGYNFAGWYTDEDYTCKITRILKKDACDMTLYAKWTAEIDNYGNVEMYSYHMSSLLTLHQKELKECNYEFLDELSIPGMPSTRESDYLENAISSDDLCMQGLTFTPDYIIMTAYTDDEDEPGALMVFDRADGTYLVTLGMKNDSHLGGVAFDGENLWVCHSNSKTLERISYEYIQLIAEDAPGYCVDASAISDEYCLKNTPSCITYYGDRIWVATYSGLFHSTMYSYTYDAKSDTLTALNGYSIPSKVQGVAFDSDGTVYLSTSLGRDQSSYLKVYSSLLELNSHPDTPSVNVEMPPCSEEIAVADDYLYVLFESASTKYFEGTDGKGTSVSPIDKVLEVEMASIW